MWHLSYDLEMALQREERSSDKSLELFARKLKENSSRYEQEALTLLEEGSLYKLVDGVSVKHFLRDGGSAYQISSETSQQPEEIFFQSLSDDPEYRIKLLIDQIAQSEVDASFLIQS
jgi:hypothetical protein